MCGCSSRPSQPSKAAERDPDALAIRVEGMACGHCADTITKAIEAGLPGTKVEADPSSKIVLVRGSSDLASIKALVTGAGYTPTEAALG